MADVMEQHNQFISSMQSRSAKLQVIAIEVLAKFKGSCELLFDHYLLLLYRISMGLYFCFLIRQTGL